MIFYNFTEVNEVLSFVSRLDLFFIKTHLVLFIFKKLLKFLLNKFL